MKDTVTYDVPAEFVEKILVDNDKYLALYQQSVDDSGNFCGKMGKRIDWISPLKW